MHRGNVGYGQSGTAFPQIGQNLAYRMAGKSGTAQVVEIRQGETYDERQLSEYPAQARLVHALRRPTSRRSWSSVLVENGGGGGAVAAPVVRQVIDAYPAPASRVVAMTARDFVRTLPPSEARSAAARLRRIHLDPIMLLGLLVIMGCGLVVLYSAAGRNLDMVVNQMHAARAGARRAGDRRATAGPVLPSLGAVAYAAGLLLLVRFCSSAETRRARSAGSTVPGMPQFQPVGDHEIAVPMMVAWYLHDRPLPPRFRDLCVAVLIMAVPAALIVEAARPRHRRFWWPARDFAVIVLAGLSWRWMAASGLASPSRRCRLCVRDARLSARRGY